MALIDGNDLSGYVVFKRYGDELQIVDVLTVPDVDAGVALVAGVASVASNEAATSVGMWLNVTRSLHRALERLGFLLREPITYFGGLALQPEITNSGVFDYAQWHLTMGDSDVF